MPRKITMTGDDARYTERRSAQMPDDGREILMEGKRAVYEELASENGPHFPLCRNEEEGRLHFEGLVRWGFIARTRRWTAGSMPWATPLILQQVKNPLSG